MDADSVMDGEAIVTLLQGMVGNPRIGILQSNPRPVFRETVFGRMQQFASHLYGSVFSYSMQAMYMGHAIYIGHNAMIRVKPFMRYAILPQLKGKKPWGGKPLSHDIIEAVALGRAGYEVWFLPELSGSYEEIPANMLGFLIRERRWMMGNLQHIRFWFLRGVQGLHRETLINGVMAYFSAPLWFAFLFVSAYGVLHFMGVVRISVVGLKMLKVPAGMLLASSLVFLFLPRMMAVMFHIDSKRATHYGGKDKLLWSVVLETVFSFLWSPIMMIYISLFFLAMDSWKICELGSAGSWRYCVVFERFVDLFRQSFHFRSISLGSSGVLRQAYTIGRKGASIHSIVRLGSSIQFACLVFSRAGWDGLVSMAC